MDGDRKRAIFCVGVGPMIWDNFLFLELIAPSPTAHAHTCCEDFRGCRTRKMAPEIPKSLCIWPTTKRLYSCWNFAEVVCDR